MAAIKIKPFAEKHGLKITQVYELIRHNPKIVKKVKGLGTLIDEKKFEQIIERA